jgi:hypothetical protein
VQCEELPTKRLSAYLQAGFLLDFVVRLGSKQRNMFAYLRSRR